MPSSIIIIDYAIFNNNLPPEMRSSRPERGSWLRAKAPNWESCWSTLSQNNRIINWNQCLNCLSFVCLVLKWFCDVELMVFRMTLVTFKLKTLIVWISICTWDWQHCFSLRSLSHFQRLETLDPPPLNPDLAFDLLLFITKLYKTLGI